MDQQVESQPYLTRIYFSVAELSEDLINRWRALEGRAFEDNVYMSPDFVIPALKHLTPEADIVIIAIDEFHGERPRLIALGVFESRKGDYYFPFPFLRGYQCRHSFLSGVLLDECKLDRALSLLLTFIKSCGKWHAVQFNWRPVNKLAEKAVNDVLREDGIRWHQSGTCHRAILVPDSSGAAYLDSVLSKKVKKTFARRRRQLNKMGKLEWRFVQDEDLVTRAAEDFIRLENSGWKRKKDSSIASHRSDIKFFMDVVAGFAARRKVFFTEFRLNGEAISSTCNFISGKAGFAFKLGWDERFARQGLGMLSEFELVKRAPEVISHLEFVDSGTLPGSYLERLWREKRVLASGFYSLYSGTSIYLSMLEIVRAVRNVGVRVAVALLLVLILAALLM
jgi:hypothetical protein